MKVKRLISIFVVVALLACIVVFPVSASSADYDTNIVNYFDYNDAPVNYTVYPDSNTVTFPLHRRMYVRYIDFVVGTGQTLNSVSVTRGTNTTDLTKVTVGNGIYRFYGEFGGGKAAWDDKITFNFDVTSSGADIQVFSLDYSNSPYEFWGDVGTLEVFTLLDSSNVKTATMKDKNTPAVVVFNAEDVSTSFVADFYCLDWRKYDYLDFYIILDTAGINSIAASIDFGLSVPVTLSYLNSNGDLTSASEAFTNTDIYTFPNGLSSDWISVHMDLTKVNKSVDGTPRINITGVLGVDEDDYSISLVSVSGMVAFDNQSPLSVWFGNLKAWFNTLGTKIDNLNYKIYSRLDKILSAITGNSSAADEAGEDMKEAAGDLDDMGAAFDQVETPDIDAAALTGNFTNFSPGGLAVLAAVTSNQYVTAMLVVVFTFALCGYIFFGKKR